MEDLLYIEYRVYVNPQFNGDLLTDIAERIRESLQDSLTDIPVHDETVTISDNVTFEIVREIHRKEN